MGFVCAYLCKVYSLSKIWNSKLHNGEAMKTALIYGILGVVKDMGAFEKNTWGWQQYAGINFHDGDMTIEGKSSICGFSGTNLDYILRSHEVSEIVLGGLLTNICIETTMRTAYGKGYKTHALIDCMAIVGKSEQEAAVKYTFPMFFLPTATQAWVA
jgi:ureidoacrylate peracid hydrolase